MLAASVAVVVAVGPVAAGDQRSGEGERTESAEPVEAAVEATSGAERSGVVDLGLEPSAPGAERWQGPPINLSLRDADLVEVLRSLARLAGVNLLVDPKVEGTVTLELHEVPLDQAFHVILKSHGLGVDVSRGMARVRAPQ